MQAEREHNRKQLHVCVIGPNEYIGERLGFGYQSQIIRGCIKASQLGLELLIKTLFECFDP